MNFFQQSQLLIAAAAVLPAAVASAAVTTVDTTLGSNPFGPGFPTGGTEEETPDGPGGPSTPPPAPFEYSELLINGDFETGDLTGWLFDGRPAWQVSQGSVGQESFGPGGTNFFANTLSSGGFNTGQNVTLDQVVQLPAGIEDELLVSFKTFAAFDSIEVRLEWLELTPDGLEVVSVDNFGTFGGVMQATDDDFMQVVNTPADATHFRFAATGTLGNGNWIDAGIDDASVLSATAVPEPAVMTLVAGAALVLLRRR